MRIPSDQFDTVAVSEVSCDEKMEQQHRSNQQPSPAASLFSGLQLKLPQFQFRIRSPGSSSNATGEGESGSSVPSSPTFSRHGSERRKETVKQQLSQAPQQRFLHSSLSRHQSLSTNNTPNRLDTVSSLFFLCLDKL